MLTTTQWQFNNYSVLHLAKFCFKNAIKRAPISSTSAAFYTVVWTHARDKQGTKEWLMSLVTGPSPLTVVWDEYGVTSHCHTTPDGDPHSFHDSRNINDIGVTCFAAPSKMGVGGHCPINYESGCCEGIILHSPWKIMVSTTNLHLWTISEGNWSRYMVSVCTPQGGDKQNDSTVTPYHQICFQMLYVKIDVSRMLICASWL